MKRWIPLLLGCVLMLAACGSDPVQTQPEPSATVPVETAPATSQSTTEPVPTEESVPETAPTETEPVFEPYLIRIDDPEKPIYGQPGFRYGITALFEEAGTYTIVEEAYDPDGNLWGRLKSGIGWVCLTEPAIVPVFADFAPEHFVSDYEWHCGESEYVTDIWILANQTVTDVSFSVLDIFSEYEASEVLYTLEEMHADEALKVSVVFWGDFTTYGLSFTDSNGQRRSYALMISGKDGSLVCNEYIAD